MKRRLEILANIGIVLLCAALTVFFAIGRQTIWIILFGVLTVLNVGALIMCIRKKF